MAAPPHVPVPPTERAQDYLSPRHVPESWRADRAADLPGRQPVGKALGYQGPDQGYALTLANRFKDRVQLLAGEHLGDAIQGAIVIALRRASLFGRAPVIHDLEIAFTIWGFLEPSPPAELGAERRTRFEGLAHTTIHYLEARELASLVPEATLRMTPADVRAAYPARWRELVGV